MNRSPSSSVKNAWPPGPMTWGVNSKIGSSSGFSHGPIAVSQTAYPTAYMWLAHQLPE
jgi:hypothetical protein